MTEPTQTEILDRIKALRTPSEPEGSTDDREAVDVSVETPEEEAPAVEEAPQSEEEEVATEETPETSGEEQESLYVEIDGEEISLDDIKQWKEGNLRLSDYTRKTQDLAENRKVFESDQSKQKDMIESLQSHIDMLAEMTDAEFKDVDWDELRDLDTAEYLKLKEKKESKKGKLDKARETRKQLADTQLNELIASEQKKLVQALPDWADPKKQQADTQLIQDYWRANNWTDKECDAIVNHKQMLTVLDAARFHQLKTKAPATAKKVKKAPLVVKGKKASVSSIEKQIMDAQSRLKKSGNMEDAMALKKLKRQLGK